MIGGLGGGPRADVDRAGGDLSGLVSAGTPLQSGDLVFFGEGPAEVTHVGLFLGIQNGQAIMVDAPHEGADVRVEPFPMTVGARWGSDVYLGASTPAAG